MAQEGQKTKKYESVRIWPKPKERLEKLMLTKRLRNPGEKVTEVELASAAVEAYCTKEERKLGII